MVIISGNTFAHKNAIKALGFRWNAQRKVWTADSATDTTIQSLEGLRGLIISVNGEEIGDTRSHKQKYGRCEDAPCCGCCGPQGDGDYYGYSSYDGDYDDGDYY